MKCELCRKTTFPLQSFKWRNKMICNHCYFTVTGNNGREILTEKEIHEKIKKIKEDK